MKLFSRTKSPDNSAAQTVPIVGLMRFSVLFATQNAFRQMKERDVDERRALLFASERMEERFRFFEALTLPSLAAQGRDDWTQIILHSTELPGPWMTRLRDLVAPHPHIRLHAMAPGDKLGPVTKAQLRKAAGLAGEVCVSFRIDDDDAMASTYITRLRQMLARYGAPGTAFTFPSGHALQVEPGEGIRLNPQVRIFGIGIGLAVLARLDERRTTFNLGAMHTRVDQSMPTVSDASTRMFIVAAHGSNDSERGVGNNALSKIAPRSVPEVMEALGPDFAHVRLEKLL